MNINIPTTVETIMVQKALYQGISKKEHMITLNTKTAHIPKSPTDYGVV